MITVTLVIISVIAITTAVKHINDDVCNNVRDNNGFISSRSIVMFMIPMVVPTMKIVALIESNYSICNDDGINDSIPMIVLTLAVCQ